MMEDLAEVLNELVVREPLFHNRDLVATDEDFFRETAEDFWEVGASGSIYDRGVVLRALQKRWADSDVDVAEIEGWTTVDHNVQQIAEATFLFTYTLHGQGRVTRRTTIWQRRPDRGWCALFHQGTVV